MHTLILAAALAAGPPPDLVLRNVTVYDGTGKPGFLADVAVRGDRVVGVGTVDAAGAKRVIDGTGHAAAPGFIDLHTHCDLGDPTITQPAGRPNRCYLVQGVTTVVTGNCGSGPTDVAAFFRELEADGGVGTNVIHQVPHNSVRAKVMGNAARPPVADELRRMEDLVDRGMRDGAWGLSTGLIYTPGTYAKTDEIVALAKVAARHGGHYASHVRDEAGGLLDAVAEAIAVGRAAGCPVHVSHLKTTAPKASPAADALALIARARADGLAVTADQYPYLASSTSLAATVVPARFREGTPKEYRARLDDPEVSAAIRKAVAAKLESRGGRGVVIARYKPERSWQGRSLAEIAASANKDPADVVLEIEKNGGASVVNFSMREEDVRLIMRQPFVATASDGSTQVPGDTVPHPRSYGTFPRKIGRYAIAEGWLPVEQAVRSASGLPADVLKLTDRGYLKPGQFADVVVFDPKAYRDAATFEKPHEYAGGVRYLLVNGVLAIEGGEFKDARAGRVLRHAGE